MKHPIAIIFLMNFCLCAGVVGAEPATQPSENAKSPKTIEEELDRVVPEVTFDGVGLTDTIDFLREISKLNIFVDWKNLEGAGLDRNAPVTLSMKNTKYADVLQGVGDAVFGRKGKIVYKVQGDEIVITTKEGLADVTAAFKPNEEKLDDKTKAQLARRVPGLNVDGMTLKDCVDFLEKAGGAKIDVDWDRFAAQQGVDRNDHVTMNFHNVSLGDSLRFIFLSAEDLPIEITVVDNHLHISPGERPPHGL